MIRRRQGASSGCRREAAPAYQRDLRPSRVPAARHRPGCWWKRRSACRSGRGLAGGAWIAGADLCHFFPGVPAEADAALAFFRALGFDIGADENASYDLARDLGGYAIPDAVAETIERLRGQGIAIAPCREQDVPALRAHLQETFPGRWDERHDAPHRDGAGPVGDHHRPRRLRLGRRGQPVLGFAHTFSARSRWIGPPSTGAARLARHYGGLGPIGLAVRARKLGLGLALLAAGVQAVADTGATHMAIDWTNLLDFYAKVGFTPWKSTCPFGVRRRLNKVVSARQILQKQSASPVGKEPREAKMFRNVLICS